MPTPVDVFEPGQKVVVTQQIARRDQVSTIQVTGTVVRSEQKKTGSWFAGGANDDKLWLDSTVFPAEGRRRDRRLQP